MRYKIRATWSSMGRCFDTYKFCDETYCWIWLRSIILKADDIDYK